MQTSLCVCLCVGGAHPPLLHCLCLSKGKVSTVICQERWWKTLRRCFFGLRPLCFPNWSCRIAQDMRRDPVEPSASRQQHYHSFSPRRAFPEYAKREIGAWSSLGPCSYLSAPYGNLMGKKKTYNSVLEHLIISAFLPQNTAQHKQHCAPRQKMKGVPWLSHKPAVSIARYHRRRRSIPAQFRHLQSLMQIGNHHKSIPSHRGEGCTCLPGWVYLSNKMIYFFKGSQMERVCKMSVSRLI